MTITCQVCSNTFEGRSHAKTCSAKCRKRLQRSLQTTSQTVEQIEVKKQSLVEKAAAEIKHEVKAVEQPARQLEHSQAGFAAIAEPLELTQQPISIHPAPPPTPPAPQVAPTPQPLASPAQLPVIPPPRISPTVSAPTQPVQDIKPLS